MSRGYVVRGKYADGDTLTGRYVNLDEAAGYRAERLRWGATEATIYAVAEDGTETPLPTYEEALSIVDHARRLTCDGYIDSALAWVDRNRGDNLREMVGIQDAGHIEEMADKIRRLHAERDARDKAWARLVRAAADDIDSMHLSAADPTEENVAEHSRKNAEYWAARRALRDLGVDADALLAEARDVAEHACPDCGEDSRNAAHEGIE